MSAVVVTGAARGLGAAIGERFAREGYEVFGVDLDGDALRERVDGWPGTHVACCADITDEAAVGEVCERAAAGGLQAFVANAGHARAGASMDYPLEQWHKMLDVHLTGFFIGARQAAARMSAGGSIVVLSSINGQVGFPGRTAYGAAKAGVAGLVKGLATEWAANDVRVNAIAPGPIRTEMSAEFIRRGVIREQDFLGRVPLRRFGKPEEVAELAHFLGSPLSSYITGTVIPIDGGWTAQGTAD